MRLPDPVRRIAIALPNNANDGGSGHVIVVMLGSSNALLTGETARARLALQINGGRRRLVIRTKLSNPSGCPCQAPYRVLTSG